MQNHRHVCVLRDKHPALQACRCACLGRESEAVAASFERGLMWKKKRGTHLDPGLVTSIVTRLAAAVNLLPLAWRSHLVGAADGSLPVLHLGDRGGRKNG